MEQLALALQDTRRLHPKWGYDMDLVRNVKCFTCGQPIGDEEYVEETWLARFGQMCFRHKQCDEKLSKLDQEGH